ncbi:MAG: tetratricopeptide repeat protein [Treponema sp.]|nr:tetratricopeptide repeat protein [Treponema sp.]
MNKTDENSSLVKRKSKLIPIVSIIAAGLAVLTAATIFTVKKVSYRIHNTPSITMLQDKWAEFDYQSVYDVSSILLEKNMSNNTILTYRGYSAFYLAVSQTESDSAHSYIDESIRCLRIALQDSKQKTIPQISYILGKAYYFKNTICSYYYYADLAVKYLEAARSAGYKADDIPEYLGLSYANLGMTYESIRAFSEALLVRESDSLLLSIAEQYYKQKNLSAAKQYLFQVRNNTKDNALMIRASILLGQIYLDDNDTDQAEKEFLSVLSLDNNIADAHYYMGEIYEHQGDKVKARAEYRNTLKIDINHEKAMKKIYH